jgi:3-phosphoshikimate 1-carboxyvinyltransferase
LISGLYAEGATTVSEAVLSSDHTERALEALGCSVSTFGPVVRLEPAPHDRAIPGFDAQIPGSPSAAAYLQAVAAATPSSHLVVRDVSLNPTRASFLEILRSYGAEVGLSPRWASLGEPGGEVSVKARHRAALHVGGELSSRLDHEFYALVFLATRAEGTSEFSGLPAWLTPTDVARIVASLRSFGVGAETTEGGLFVAGKGERPLGPTRFTTGGDPRLAVLGSLLALCAESSSQIDDVESLSVLFPKFLGTLRALGARLEVKG